MKPEANSMRLFGITQAKARMYEYGVRLDEHIVIPAGTHPEDLFALAIGILGDEAAAICDQCHQRGTVLGTRNESDQQALRFAASFFYAYVESKFDAELDEELLTLAAATFYLAETPGSSLVVSNLLSERFLPPLDPFTSVLRRALINRWNTDEIPPDTRFSNLLSTTLRAASDLLSRDGSDERILLRHCDALRKAVYRNGAARDIAFADLFVAVTLRKASNSSRLNLPRYSRLDEEAWSDVLRKASFVSELWPAQRLLGQAGLFAGASAVVQMPTSAGKTRAIELVIRSAKLSGRARTAVVVAPFRALCHEISNSLRQTFAGEQISIDELSDVLQQDFLESLAELLGEVVDRTPQVLVLTPEKLLYVLRQAPQIATKIGLVVYDEGHQFDSGPRGVTYELLLTTLKQHLERNAQVVLVSAVISNAAAVGRWLIGERAFVVDGQGLMPTQRSVVFTSWQHALGTLQFDALGQPDDFPYFVPRVIEPYTFPLRGRERVVRVFPGREPSDVALYLGLKLAPQGSAAIFCGRKDSAAGIVRDAVQYFERGLPYPSPADIANQDELAKLVYLHVKHFGEGAVVTRGARFGLLAHHGNTPQGLRLCIEHAVKEELVPLVVCTSTLAQGVNLPLRYLIVSTIYQGGERVKVRDFHNLMGRAGRAGMHIEGSVIFADTRVFDGRNVRRERWRWNTVRDLLKVDNVEPTGSSLLELVSPIMNDDGTQEVQPAFDVVIALLADEENALAQINDDAEYLGRVGATPEHVAAQVKIKERLVNAVASFLQASRGDVPFEDFVEVVRGLAQSTLAYTLASDAEKTLLVEIFIAIARAVQEREPEAANQTRNSRTLLGLNALVKIYRWCEREREAVLSAQTQAELLSTIWPILLEVAEDELLQKVIGKELLIDVAQTWLSGASYAQIGEVILDAGIAKRHGEGARRFTPEDVVDICDNCFGYEFSLYLTALVTYFDQDGDPNTEGTVDLIKELQSGLKYGLPDPLTVAIQEAGFSDRMLSQDLRPVFEGVRHSRGAVFEYVRNSPDAVRPTLDRYPSYFRMVLDGIAQG
ncbi:DEAD/DEAH box helicase [Burkholderia thailandensis]|uniref:DEAD/DEAH box helicase n=1 Tax=Burkholderia thailandensis TaxID=57975 RepID=UPI0022ABF552|nr:DEAD/DEAH box helicase [Burkholderia thailandensis]MCZ2897032.1 DEAD/DEAH box helicase [Burkholderia thailandensis]